MAKYAHQANVQIYKNSILMEFALHVQTIREHKVMGKNVDQTNAQNYKN